VRNIVPHIGFLKHINWWWWSWSFRGIYERSIEVLLFIPVVFKVVRWDYSSLLVIMEPWLGRMQDVHEKNKHHTKECVDHAVKTIKTARILCKRLAEDKYSDSFHEEHDKRWGEMETWTTPTDETKQWFTWNHSRPKAIYPHEKIQENKEYKKWILEHPEYLKKQDIDYLFRIIKKHYRGWWI